MSEWVILYFCLAIILPLPSQLDYTDNSQVFW